MVGTDDFAQERREAEAEEERILRALAVQFARGGELMPKDPWERHKEHSKLRNLVRQYYLNYHLALSRYYAEAVAQERAALESGATLND